MLLSMAHSGCGVQVDLLLPAASGLLTLAFFSCLCRHRRPNSATTPEPFERCRSRRGCNTAAVVFDCRRRGAAAEGQQEPPQCRCHASA